MVQRERGTGQGDRAGYRQSRCGGNRPLQYRHGHESLGDAGLAEQSLYRVFGRLWRGRIRREGKTQRISVDDDRPAGGSAEKGIGNPRRLAIDVGLRYTVESGTAVSRKAEKG